MSPKLLVVPALLAGLLALSEAPPPAGPANPAMVRGAVELVSVGPLTFAEDGTLFLADSYGASVYALDLEEEPAGTTPALEIEGLGARIGGLLGTGPQGIRIHDLAVSPVSREVFVTVTRGRTDGTPIKNALNRTGTPHLIRVASDGSLHEVDLGAVLHERATLSDVRGAGQNRHGHDNRAWNVVELAYADGTLYVSGLSNEEWSAKLRRLPYPFAAGAARSSAFRIFHTAHGQYETGAPARVFVPYTHDGETRVFAGFSCTPLVDLSVDEMERAQRVEGKTIAELGAGNHVLDMIGVERDGETWFLLANHLHDFMRLARSDFDGASSLTRPTSRAGIDRTPLRSMDGVTRLSSDRDERVVYLQESGDDLDLETRSVDELLR